MGLPQLTFANRQIYKSLSDELYEGQIIYNNGGYWTDIGDCVPFSCYLSGTPVDEILFTYADGKQIHMEYTLTTETSGEMTTYILKSIFKLTDANGNLIQMTGNPTNEVTDTEQWSATQPGFDVIPFSEMYYVPATVDYYQNQSTVVGDEANVLYQWGNVFWKRSRPPVGGYKTLLGTKELNTVSASFGNRYVPGLIVLEADYNSYFNLVDPDDEWHVPGVKPPAPDPSGPGGGDRPSDDGGEAVDFPDLPTTSVINTGLISLYNPDNSQLRSLAGVLWGNDFEQSIKKVLNDPFDGLIGLSMVPFTPTTSGSIGCQIGNFDTEVSMPLVSAQYYTLNCGSVTVQENWHNALDYNSTSCEIFVPFVGFRPLDIQDVMGRTLALIYNVDILTGAAIAVLKCGDKCLYEWPCNLAYNIPLTGSNKAALYTGLINVAMSGLGGLAAGGAMGAVGGAATSAINVATHAQSNVQRSGSLASNTGVLGEFTPYIILHRPKQSLAQNFKTYKGYQANITMNLASCRGYTEIEYVHLSGIDGATDTELDEIEQLLKSGVII